MKNLLRVDSSARTEASHSRALGDYLLECAQAYSKGLTVRTRDLVAEPVEQIHQSTIAGFYTPEDQMTDELRAATALSDKLIAEVQWADTILITAPMYNFSAPSALKAWIDQVVRINRTFSYEDGKFSGLVGVNKAYVCCAYGAGRYGEGGDFAAANFLEPYLRFVLEFLGIEQVKFFSAELLTADEATVQAAIDRTKAQIAAEFNPTN
ncbi:NAD(P)H-dependent oxidoreductase [Parasphingorhabdus flavimaris]|uniref:FMN dependent NADH:quinone oxidoreductase n=1 Tax=Parasphingorhabdus flavimaris TaxID=266812 RepID=A0ABX2MZH3_9SPHN|nr:NAD(P)H-dependent oxidoreductase [Parasphingorhabdus flavimaris]NVD26803.1 NAD(P)H-dependent oxidoreductase [Parasphingorhabdus flavimaris]